MTQCKNGDGILSERVIKMCCSIGWKSFLFTGCWKLDARPVSRFFIVLMIDMGVKLKWSTDLKTLPQAKRHKITLQLAGKLWSECDDKIHRPSGVLPKCCDWISNLVMCGSSVCPNRLYLCEHVRIYEHLKKNAIFAINYFLNNGNIKGDGAGSQLSWWVPS